MRLMRRPFGPRARLLLVFFGLWLLVGSAHAQTSAGGGSSDLFQGLTSEEQQAVLGRLGGNNLGGGTTELNQIPGQLGAGGALSQSQQQEFEQEMEVRRQRAQEEEQPLVPVLNGGDWVIVQIGFQLAPAAVSQSSQAIQQQLSGSQAAELTPQRLQALQALQGSASSGASALTQAASASSQSLSELTDDQKKQITALVELIRSRDPYQLSADGVLTLPGFAPIPLLGLTEQQATLRLQIVPDFEHLQIRLTLLPLKKTGAQALKPFGYDLFAEYPSSFEPLTNVPVPSNYIVGPGDVLDVLLYGNQNHAYQMDVGKDGRINFPELGPLNVGGQLFTAVESQIESRISHQMIGVRASVSMAMTRSIQVFVMGDGFEPGAYTVSGLATITSALYAAGGIRKTGSMRNIELKRDGVTVGKLDLYDLLLHGSTADDGKLLQGDVVLIPPVGSTVAIDGQVERPAIYELKNETAPAEMVALAGGLTPNADASKATLTRIMPNGQRVVLPLDLTAGGAEGVRNGDLINIPQLRPTLDAAVELQGHVYTAGAYFYRSGMRLTDVIRSVDDLEPNPDLHYVLIRRELPPNRHVVALSADLAAALAAPGSSADVPLMPRDQITVFDLSSSRDRIVQPILDDLKSEATEQQPEQVVTVEGRVNVPGQYPLQSDMTVADVIRAGGGLADAAYAGKAELTRYVVVQGGTRNTQIIDIDLAAALRGDPAANLKLDPYDVLSVKEVSQWTNQESITLSGQVRFPGSYTIKPGETLKSVIERAGGLTEYAFPQGAVFTRVELKDREQQQMDMLAQRMRVELGVLALRAVATSSGSSAGGGDASNALIVGRSLLGQLQGEKAVGRLVISLRDIMREPADSPYDVVLRNGDQLMVPKFEQEVTVIGEVQDATSHLYNPGLSRDDYISLSGGFTTQADEKRIYVVRANGSVLANNGSRWFNRGNIEIETGDTIVVPINAEQMLPLPFWEAVTGIMYNVAIAAAAVHAL
jgi:polysaccharide biosynthesis/export protein